MGILPDLSADEYHAFKRILAELDAFEEAYGGKLRDHPVEPVREIDAMRVKMRAAVEGYEAIHGKGDDC